MTTGQIVFYSGVGLLVLTVLTAFIFYIKKPQYLPENAAYGGRGDGSTQKLRNGYSTERITKRWKKTASGPETEKMESVKSTETLQETSQISSQTETLDPSTEKMTGTLKLDED